MMELEHLGFGPFFRDQDPESAGVVARIAAHHRTGYTVWGAEGVGPARLAGTLARDLEGEALPGVGDWVRLVAPPHPDHIASIEEVFDRRTLFLRESAGRRGGGQVIAANVDRVFLVCGLDADFNLRRIERYLARIHASGAVPTVVLNKADRCDGPGAYAAEVAASIGEVEILVVSALHGQGLEAIRQALGRGVTGVFVGSSGAGKSTLVNALMGDDHLATAPVRERDGRGCHTTTHRQLFQLPWGGLVIDTPGMRELALFDAEGLDRVFADIEALAGGCRYRDCTHRSEPGCAVRRAVEAGELPAERLDHHHRLQAEAAANELRRDTRRHRAADRAFGKMVSRDSKRLRRWKEGG